MKYINVLVTLFCFSCAEHTPETVHKRNDKITNTISVIDVLFENVNKVTWEQENLICYNKILTILQNALNSTLWATWVIDSMQLPTGILYGSKYQLGNYDECMKSPWTGTHPDLQFKYCLADVILHDAEPGKFKGEVDPYGLSKIYVNTKTKHGRKLNTITWGVCVPTECNEGGVASFVRAVGRSSLIGSHADLQVKVDPCRIAGGKETGLGLKIFIISLVFLSILAVTSTWYLATWSNTKTEESYGTKIVKCFCVNRNASNLVKTSREDIPVVHGMRALTAIILVYTHQIFFVNSGPIGNGLDVDKFLDDSFFVLHSDLFTDTFLLMSGLLLAKGLASQKQLGNPITILWKRYIRLVGPMAVVVFFLISVFIHIGDGPLWLRLVGTEQKMCEKNWWISLLMLNNYINIQEMCFITLWYIPTDFHLTIFGVIVMYSCRSHSRVAVITVIITTALMIMMPAIATYQSSLPATIIYDIPTMIDIRQNVNFNSTYVKSHYRGGSYLVGLYVGYLMAVYNPNLHRKTISKRWSIFIFALSFALSWVPMSLGGVFYTRPYNAVEAAAYAASNRIVWAAVLSALIVVCEYGELPIINGLLSWQVWVPLSRLSYGLYLTHPIIILYNVFSARTPLHHNLFTMLSDSFGPVVLGYILSLLLWLLVQAPIDNLISCLPMKSMQQTDVNGEKNKTS